MAGDVKQKQEGQKNSVQKRNLYLQLNKTDVENDSKASQRVQACKQQKKCEKHCRMK
jgi:hypothetical protein